MMLLEPERPPGDGFFNMALDGLLAEEVEAGRLDAFVRLYGWKPPAISLGRNQPDDEVDGAACRRDGVDVVRRPTGGRAVFHRDELTYSLGARLDDPVFGGSARDAYRAVGRGLCRGLRLLGVEAELVRAAVPGQRTGLSPSCFAASGRYELAVDGKKIVGSAQRRFAGSFLQQGSVLLCQVQDHPYFRHPAPPGSFTTAERVLGRPVPFDEAARAMERGMAEEWGVAFAKTPTDPGLVERALALAGAGRAAGTRPAQDLC